MVINMQDCKMNFYEVDSDTIWSNLPSEPTIIVGWHENEDGSIKLRCAPANSNQVCSRCNWESNIFAYVKGEEVLTCVKCIWNIVRGMDIVPVLPNQELAFRTDDSGRVYCKLV